MGARGRGVPALELKCGLEEKRKEKRGERARARLHSDEAGVACSENGLGAVGHLELTQNIRHVIADCLGTQDQLVRDFEVVVSFGHQAEDFAPEPRPRGKR